MADNKKLWAWLAGIFLVSFGIPGLIGREIYVKAPGHVSASRSARSSRSRR